VSGCYNETQERIGKTEDAERGRTDLVFLRMEVDGETVKRKG